MSTPLLVSYVVLWTLVVAETVAIVALYRHFGEMYLNSREGRSIHGPDIDSVPRRLQVSDLRAATVSLPRGERPRLLVFASTDCRLCGRIRDELPAFAASSAAVEVVVICAGQARAVQTWAMNIDDAITVVPDPNYRVATTYGVGLTPFLVGVRADGTVMTKGLVNDRAALELALDELLANDGSIPMRETTSGSEDVLAVTAGRTHH